jgi:hypothetical protein
MNIALAIAAALGFVLGWTIRTARVLKEAAARAAAEAT